MKKIFITILFAGLMTPAFAVCSITGGACSAIDTPNLQEKHIPNHLDNLQKPDAFAPTYFKPYQDMLINTESATSTSSSTGAASNPNYNSNCQFGVCLPGNQTEPMPEF